MSVTVLSPEDGANFVHPLKVGANAHFLCQLRALGQESGALEVIDLEDGGTGFREAALQLGRVDLNEAFRVKETPGCAGDSREDAEYGVGGGGLGRTISSVCCSSGAWRELAHAERQGTVLHPSVDPDAWQTLAFGVRFVGDRSAGFFDTKWGRRCDLSKYPKLQCSVSL